MSVTRRVEWSSMLLSKSIPLSGGIYIFEGIQNCESGIQEGPVELHQLSLVVHLQGCQTAVVGKLEGQEDDRVQIQLDYWLWASALDSKHQSGGEKHTNPWTRKHHGCKSGQNVQSYPAPFLVSLNHPPTQPIFIKAKDFAWQRWHLFMAIWKVSNL